MLSSILIATAGAYGLVDFFRVKIRPSRVIIVFQLLAISLLFLPLTNAKLLSTIAFMVSIVAIGVLYFSRSFTRQKRLIMKAAAGIALLVHVMTLLRWPSAEVLGLSLLYSAGAGIYVLFRLRPNPNEQAFLVIFVTYCLSGIISRVEWLVVNMAA